jgi:hypothetical protein
MRVAVAVSMLVVLVACWLYPRGALPHASTSNSVLFDREIVRILDAHCVMCHAEGGPSFPLETYEQTWLQRQAVHDTTLARHMPPWAAVAGYGEFSNANRLTLREQRFLVSWVEGLGPRNTGVVFLNVLDPDAAARQERRARAHFDDWALGEPDRTVPLPSATVEPASTGPLRLQRTIIDPGLRSDRWLTALEYQPARRDSIRAAVFTVEGTGQWLATWTPWHGFRRLPENTGYRLAAGAKIVAEIHTTAIAGITDPGRIGLHFAAAPGRSAPADVALVAAGEVPAGATRHRLHAELRLAADIRLLALQPELPGGIESIEVRATRPDGGVEVLLLATEIPLDWPTPYIYENPVALPGGSRVALTAYVSNRDSTAAPKQVALLLSAIEH